MNRTFSTGSTPSAQTVPTVNIDWSFEAKETIMKTTALLTTIALAAVTITAASAHARDREHARPQIRASVANENMQPVPNTASAGERAHGWQYFCDPAERRAVVISPQGDYYLSQGRGLRWVAGAQTSS